MGLKEDPVKNGYEDLEKEPADEEQRLNDESSKKEVLVAPTDEKTEPIDESSKEEVSILPVDEEMKLIDESGEEEISTAPALSQEAKEKLVSYIEAALFIAGKPLGEMELARSFNTDRITVRWALRRLMRELTTQNSALEVLHLTKDRWVLQLCEEFSKGLFDYIDQFIPKEEMLTREEVNVLTEIAYRQPLTSALLVKIIANPAVYDHIKHLEEKGYIMIEPQERTNLLRTSKKFADIYGFDMELRNLKIQLVWRLKKRAQFEKI
jgi:segregation and condensation protein B